MAEILQWHGRHGLRVPWFRPWWHHSPLSSPTHSPMPSHRPQAAATWGMSDRDGNAGEQLISAHSSSAFRKKPVGNVNSSKRRIHNKCIFINYSLIIFYEVYYRLLTFHCQETSPSLSSHWDVSENLARGSDRHSSPVTFRRRRSLRSKNSIRGC